MSIDSVKLLPKINGSLSSVEALDFINSLRLVSEEEAIPLLINLLQHHHPEVLLAVGNRLIERGSEGVDLLIKEFDLCGNQTTQAQIIRILAIIGDDRALDLLIETIGVAVANHCQGNVRRVAARGLGKMVAVSLDEIKMKKAVDKLIWALLNPEDWALRYAAAISLQEIRLRDVPQTFLDQIQESLEKAVSQESDRVVKEVIKRGITRGNNC